MKGNFKRKIEETLKENWKENLLGKLLKIDRVLTNVINYNFVLVQLDQEW